jgi:hypothetical protein
MNWFLLLLLIPVFVVPTVLCFGFAGCSFHAAAFVPTAPTNLVAMPTPSSGSGSSVVLTWTKTDVNASTGTQIERAIDGGSFEVLLDPTDPSKPLVVMSETFIDSGLPGGTAFLYQVRANFFGSTSIDASNMAVVTTFKTAFIDDGLTGSTDQPSVNGFTVVQSLASTVLNAGGTLTSLTLRGPSSGVLTLDHIYISNVAAAGDPFDSDVAPVLVAANLVLNTSTIPLAPTGAFVLDQNKTLLVAFDVNAASGVMRYGALPQGGVMSYAKGPAAPGGVVGEAGAMNRTAPYAPASVLYLIHKIEVM